MSESSSSEKTLSKLFCKLSDTVISNGDTKFQINLYAHDYEALALFSMMQFGYIYEQGRLEITDYPYKFNDTYTIKTLEKDEIEKRWDEIWTLTDAIIKHLKQAPVFYPGYEFTEPVYKEFFMDSGYYKFHEAYHLLKFANEKQILEKAYNEYLDLKKSNLWGTHKYY